MYITSLIVHVQQTGMHDLLHTLEIITTIIIMIIIIIIIALKGFKTPLIGITGQNRDYRPHLD